VNVCPEAFEIIPEVRNYSQEEKKPEDRVNRGYCSIVWQKERE
jgi:hypothetical protein